jgi:hypothetical protein
MRRVTVGPGSKVPIQGFIATPRRENARLSFAERRLPQRSIRVASGSRSSTRIPMTRVVAELADEEAGGPHSARFSNSSE